MSTQELPELPSPQGVLWSAIHSTMLNSGQFTVDQMRAYGQLCRDTAQAELAKAQEEIARLKHILAPIQESHERAEAMGRNVNEWIDYAKALEADAGVAAGAEFQRLRDTVKTLETKLRATPTAPADLVEALRKLRAASHHSSEVTWVGDDDPWTDADAALSRYEAAQQATQDQASCTSLAVEPRLD